VKLLFTVSELQTMQLRETIVLFALLAVTAVMDVAFAALACSCGVLPEMFSSSVPFSLESFRFVFFSFFFSPFQASEIVEKRSNESHPLRSDRNRGMSIVQCRNCLRWVLVCQ